MANATITTKAQFNNLRMEGALTPCVAAAGRHQDAIADINATISMIDDGATFKSEQAGEAALKAAIVKEYGALSDFLQLVPVSNAEAAEKIAYLLAAPDLVDTLPEPEMRRFLKSLQTYIASTVN